MSLFGKQDGERPSRPAPSAPARPAGAGAGSRPHQTTTGTTGGSTVANIGKSISIKGDLTGNEDMVIEGSVDGKIEIPNAQLTIGANGKVKAELNAKNIVIVGHVTGNVNGTERVEVQGSGVVDGDVRAPRLIVAEGAVVNGSIQMTKREGAAASPPAAAVGAGHDVRKAAG